eukprot:scaffold3319_cov427-Prasinococcus_capsulatus_cf.AAC.29
MPALEGWAATAGRPVQEVLGSVHVHELPQGPAQGYAKVGKVAGPRVPPAQAKAELSTRLADHERL